MLNARFARFSQFDGAQFWIVLLLVTAILSKIKWYVYRLTQDSSYVLSTSSAHFGMTAYFWLRIPRSKRNKDFTEALVRKASDWSWSKSCRIRWLLPGTWSHLWFAGVRECPPWCSIVGATVTVHQFFLYFALKVSKGIREHLHIHRLSFCI